MKLRHIAILIAITLLVLAVGCGKKEMPAPQQSPTGPSAPSTPTAPAEQAAPSGEAETSEVKAGEEKIVEVPETEMGPGVVTVEQLDTGDYKQHSLLGEPQNADSQLARDYTGQPLRFSNFDCKKDTESGLMYISVKVTNTNADRPFMISHVGVAKGYDTYFLVRGMVDTNPGCQVEELAPGESTVCNMIGLDLARYANTPGTNRLTIQSPDNAGKKVTEAVIVNCPEAE